MRRIPQRAPKKASKTVYLIKGPMQTSLSWVFSFFLNMTNTRSVRPRTLWKAQHGWQIWPHWGLSQSQLSPGKSLNIFVFLICNHFALLSHQFQYSDAKNRCLEGKSADRSEARFLVTHRSSPNTRRTFWHLRSDRKAKFFWQFKQEDYKWYFWRLQMLDIVHQRDNLAQHRAVSRK